MDKASNHDIQKDILLQSRSHFATKFKSICHHPYHSFTDAKLLDEGKEYTIVTSYTPNGSISHYDIYDGDRPAIVYMKTTVSGLSVVSFHQYFYTFEQMRDIKLKQLLNEE